MTSTVRVLDWRMRADYQRLSRAANAGTAKALFERGAVVMREPSDIVGVTWHQTGCIFGVGAQALKRFGGDRDAARNDRARDIPAHATVFADGTVIVPFALRSYLYHANALSAVTLGIEIERKGEATPMPDVQVEACHAAIAYLVERAMLEGITLTQAWGHRQSHGGKPGDPGPEIWKRVVIPACARHKLVRTIRAVPRSTPKGRDGSPIPDEWEAP
jgi:hypothetical protein